MSKTVPASEFGAGFDALITDVVDNHEEVVVVRDGEAVAKVVPLQRRRSAALEALRGSVTIHGDIVEPLDVEWDANK